MTLLLISFIAGVLTVLAPCVLPLLPVIIGGSLTGEGKDVHIKKLITVVVSLGISVIAFTLLLKASTLFITIPEYVWKWISGGILVVFGFVTLFPVLWSGTTIAKASVQSNKVLGKGSVKNSFWGDVLIGSSLGPVFSTCSPTYFIVLATVLPAKPIVGMLYLAAYTIGLCLSLALIAFVGQKMLGKLSVLSNPHGWFKRMLGLLFILIGIAIISGFDKKIEVTLLNQGYFDITRIEQKLLQATEKPVSIQDIKRTTEEVSSQTSLQNGINDVTPVTREAIQGSQKKEEIAENTSMEKTPLDTKDTIAVVQKPNVTQSSQTYLSAPEMSTLDGYINTKGQTITLGELRGKVVLVTFWTYSCINCKNTLPYLNDWYASYKDQGFEIVGIHTPEFAFEKVQKNVEDAVAEFGIRYPVVLDNDYSTWQSYGNRYWPRRYLINKDGYIVYDHIGEGAYRETEEAIKKALAE